MTFAEKIRETAEEGIVLLKNDNNVLPLTKDDTVSIFGRMQYDYYRSGTGSGGSVHVPYTTNITDSLLDLAKDGASAHVNEELAATYKAWLKNNPFDTGNGEWAAEPNFQKEMPLTEALVKKCASLSNKALFIIGRNSGEDVDYSDTEGSYRLTQTERENLTAVCTHFENVIVAFNTSGIMDMSWLEEEPYKSHISAILCIWEGGQEGGRATARVLTGKATPSGKLTDTIAKKLEDYPSTGNFGDKTGATYVEDIYVGYRYFTTFAPDRILFPFGFGLSYAAFCIENLKAECGETTVTIDLSVRNTSKTFSGKEVIQVYYSAPQGNLGKSNRTLVKFTKTKLLAPGESQNLRLFFEVVDMASYDDNRATDNKACWVLEEGDYRVFVGTDCMNAKPIQLRIKGNTEDAIHLDEDLVVSRLEQCCAPQKAFDKLRPGKRNPDGTYVKAYEPVKTNDVDYAIRIGNNLPEEIPYTGDKGIKFDTLKINPSKIDEFIAQLNDSELATLARGEGMLSQKVTAGIAAAYGGVSDALHDKYGIPCAGCSDGPSGIRMDTGKEANLMPIGTMLACTWNTFLVRELYTFEGKELAENQIDALLGPGMNIHRNPLGGRNFEYYSEDPLVTGLMAAAAIDGLHEGGSNGTIKHFATNNQEAGRRDGDSIVSERALREIYLKGFEIVVKKGVVNSIMTSYNALNGHWTASNYDLVNTILHKEWNFKGLVMTDWWACMNDCIKGGESTLRNTAAMIRARNNVYMVVDNDGAASNVFEDNIESSLKNDKLLTRGELQLSAKDVIQFLLVAPVSKRPLSRLRKTACIESTLKEAPAGARIIQEDEEFSLTEGEIVYLNAKSNATYKINGWYMKEGDDLSQSVTNIFFDAKPAASFECRTTHGVYQWAYKSINLTPGCYALSLEHTKPGITLKSLSITCKEWSPVSNGVFK